jgi:hypothetical protein
MPIRNFNPFKKAQTAQEIYEQNNGLRSSTDKGFQDAAVKATTPVEIQEPVEYKLSGMRNLTWLRALVSYSPQLVFDTDVPQRSTIAASIFL